MPDREKVMRGFECCLRNDHKKCPYYSADILDTTCYTRLHTDALHLLKEREARVLEYSEIEKHPLVWLEDNDKEDVIPALFLQYNGWNAEFSVQAHDKYVDTIVRSAIVIAFEKTYGITWRAWTSRPSPEQRKAVKWDG